MTQHPSPVRARPFTLTNTHAGIAFTVFFAVVFVVNIWMASLASSTFTGVVVENSYVASQKFNTWLATAAAEHALGWHASVARAPDGAVVVNVTGTSGTPLTGAELDARAVHPLDGQHDLAVKLREVAPGQYRAPLAAGRWHVTVTVRRDGHVWHTLGDVA